jgi:hypothetical protein
MRRAKLMAVLGIFVTTGVAAAPHLGSVGAGRIADMPHWYGRAGDLVGAQRIAGLRSGDHPPVLSAADAEVEKRTNMAGARGSPSKQPVLTTWDEGIARRTHMPLAADQHSASSNPFIAPRAVQ